MSVLILARHGNTFEKGMASTMVGARTDMNLTAEGEAQGEALTDMIAAKYMPLGGIITGSLLRTKRFAEMMGKKASNVFIVDERLTEIDYGLWENKTSEEIIATYGSELLEKWEKEGLFPEGMNWAPSQEKLERNVQRFLEEQHKILSKENALNRVVFTSNGILRFVYGALVGRPPDAEAKVKTGRFCVLAPTAAGWTIQSWNESVT
jgi:probable phosphoglycerate mutase